MTIKLPYLQVYRDRHGKIRRYVRKPRTQEIIPIKVAPDDPDFVPAYRNALTRLGLVYLPNLSPERLRVMHREAGAKWEHWQIGRHVPGGRWHRMTRTKCVRSASRV